MLGNHGRGITKAIFTPFARLLYKAHITPNMVTVAGTVVTALIAVLVIAQGYVTIGCASVGVVLFMDSVDGTLARLSGTTSKFGAFLDSTMDRIADGFCFGAVLWYAIVGLPDGWVRTTSIISGIICMCAIGVVPYVRARAETVGIEAKIGLAERTDRLVIALCGAGFAQWWNVEWLYAAGLLWVAFASTVTVFQRIWVTWRGLKDAESNEN